MEVSLQIFKKNGSAFRTLSFVWYGSENKIMVFNNENNDLNPLAGSYFSFMSHLWMFIGFLTHLCWFCFWSIFSANFYGSVDVWFLRVGNGGIGVECWIWLELVMNTPQRCQLRRSGVFVVRFSSIVNWCYWYNFKSVYFFWQKDSARTKTLTDKY